ncbi:hypothetical protein CYB_0903 [Synechococcus sp. JA-2-3B'a(2-13)]|nr:hypothetical protein CYB_0903 [Synechococcus sp. JA-2-3B'a(2-13)]
MTVAGFDRRTRAIERCTDQAQEELREMPQEMRKMQQEIRDLSSSSKNRPSRSSRSQQLRPDLMDSVPLWRAAT